VVVIAPTTSVIRIPKRSASRPLRIEPIANPIIRMVNGNDASPRGSPKSACTAGSETVNDHMPTPPIVLITTQTARRCHE
jgi:hypothetical protein